MSEGLCRKLPGLTLAAIMALHLVIASVYCQGGRPNQDEGWYLEAARLVTSGRTLYSDFAYVQPPLLPYVYGALGGHHSIEAGRNLSALFATLAIGLIGLAAWRVGAAGGLIAAALLAFCPFAITIQVLVKTYALTATLLALGCLLALRVPGRGGVIGASLAFALVTLTRNSAAPVLVGWWLWLALDRDRRRYLLLAVAASILPLVAVYLPFWLRDRAALYYNLIGHHASQSIAEGGTSRQVQLASMLVVASSMVSAAPAMITLLGVGWFTQRQRLTDDERAAASLAAILLVMLSASQFVSAHPFQEYQVLALPPGALLAGLIWGPVLARSSERPMLTGLLVAMVGLVPLVAIGPDMWDLPGLKMPGGIQGPLHQVVRLVQAHSAPNEPIFTFQTNVAIEANRRLTPGLTLASFSFVSSDDEARRLHLMSPGLLREQFETALPATVVVSPGDLQRIIRATWQGERLVPVAGLEGAARALYGPIVQALDRNYKLVGAVEDVGQFGESFWVLARRGERR